MGKIRSVLLAIKFPRIEIFFSPSSFAFNKMDVIKKPLSTKNRLTPNFGRGTKPIKIRDPMGPK
jgi:hypothetical protein